MNARPNRADLKAVATVDPRDSDSRDGGPLRQDDNPRRFGYVLGNLVANLKLLLIGLAVAGIVAFAGASLLPRSYTSVAYLNLDEASAQAADVRIRSIPVLDRVLSRYEAPGVSAEARRAYIQRNLRILMASGDLRRKGPHLYRMEYSDRSPSAARTVQQQLLEAWLETTKPGADERAAIDGEIQRLEAQAKVAQSVIDDLDSDMREPFLRKTRGTLAEMIASLSIRQEETLARITVLKNSLNGLSRDVVMGEPTLPEQPSWPNTAIIVILTMAATSLLLPVLLIGWSALRAFRRNAGRRPAAGSALNP